MNSKSKSKNPTPIRVFGQRSIASVFRSLPPDSSRDSEEASVKGDSTFSHRKLQQSSQPPQTVPGKLTPFQCLRIPTGEKAGNVKQVKEDKTGATTDDKVIIEMFKHTKEEGKHDFVIPLDGDELENSVADDIQESRKNPFEGRNENQTFRNHVVVLGGESRLKPIKQMGNDSGNKNPRPFDSDTSVRNQASHKSESTHVSLPYFLDSKLPKSSLPPLTLTRISNPFLSPLGLRKPMGEEAGNVKQVEKENNSATIDDKVIIGMFKHTKEGKHDFVIPIDVDELENSVEDDTQESRKRKNPFEGGNENQIVRNHVVVLGGGSGLKPKRQMENDSGNKKQRPLYNHYKNGRGWWDYDREGVDNEELGYSEVWEGVGSTTLGGLVDWH